MSNLSGFVKRIRDIMRNDAGINGDAPRIEQIAWMMFLKVYDAKEQALTSPIMRELERVVMLRVVDEYWMDRSADGRRSAGFRKQYAFPDAEKAPGRRLYAHPEGDRPDNVRRRQSVHEGRRASPPGH